MAQPADLVHGLPLKGVVLCSTSLPQDLRIKLADYAVEMGAVHKLDLTGDVTHLLVGDVQTPKYRYVAKSRPDIKILRASWIEEIHKQWLDGEDVDVEALESQCQLPALFGLHICLTGFTNLENRNELETTIRKHGADYSGDLSKQISHLIVAVPQGAKYNAAKQWGLHCVTLKWLTDSITRNMALDESLYDPLLPEAVQGKGAFKLEVKPVTGKRGRESSEVAAPGKRKFRRTASTRLEEHSQDLWQDISAMSGANDETSQDQWKEDESAASKPVPAAPAPDVAVPQAVSKMFSDWRMCLQGFDDSKAGKLKNYLIEQCGADVVDSASQLRLGNAKAHCILVPHLPPQSLYYLAKPVNQTIVATEWWVERCIHAKRILDVDADALSKPFWRADLPDLAGTNVSSTGLNSIDLRQMATIVKTAGAAYQETMTSETSVLISASSSVKKEKAFYAKKHNIPTVSPEWLWSSVRLKRKQSFEPYMIEQSVDSVSRSNSTRSSRATNQGPQAHTASKPQTRAKGPFIHEDDDAGSPGVPTESVVLPLQEVSPNLSSPRKHASSNGVMAQQDDNQLAKKMRSPEEITADIASLSKQLQESRSGKAGLEPDSLRRKKRTLGRAASAISNRSYSADQAADEPFDPFDDRKPSDSAAVAAPPSTQLGYEVPEAEAHREQMAKRMGTTFTDESAGKKLASIGTVRDTEVQTRSRRQKANR